VTESCATCGAIVDNIELHEAWHSLLDIVLVPLRGGHDRPWAKDRLAPSEGSDEFLG
jgi:hypothetical protein